MYSNLLVPLDGSVVAEAALSYAQRLARSFGASVELLCAVESHRIPEEIRWDV